MPRRSRAVGSKDRVWLPPEGLYPRDLAAHCESEGLRNKSDIFHMSEGGVVPVSVGSTPVPLHSLSHLNEFHVEHMPVSATR